MNYHLRAVKIIYEGEDATLEDYEKDFLTYESAVSEQIRLKSIGGYVNIIIEKIKKASLN